MAKATRARASTCGRGQMHRTTVAHPAGLRETGWTDAIDMPGRAGHRRLLPGLAARGLVARGHRTAVYNSPRSRWEPVRFTKVMLTPLEFS
jgi:hypothetical protein